MESVVEKPRDLIRLYDEKSGVWKFVRRDKGALRSLETIEETLFKLGLSKNEARVYLYLARTGERKASEISKALSLHRTETYRILRDLEKKGLVLSVFQKPLKFVATPFEKAMDLLIESKKMRIRLLEREKSTLVKLWFSLPHHEIKLDKKDIFQILEGEEQVGLKANELLKRTKREIYVFAPGDDLAQLYHVGFLDKLERFSNRKFVAMLLTDCSMKSNFFIEKMRPTKLAHFSVKVEDLPCFIISDSEELLLIIRESNTQYNNNLGKKRSRVMALWTNYSAIVKTLRILFMELRGSKSFAINSTLDP